MSTEERQPRYVPPAHQTAEFRASRRQFVSTEERDRWQREDGFPSDEYFEAVAEALKKAGIPIDDWWRDEDHTAAYELGEGARRGYADLQVAWRCDEEDHPTHADDFTGLGWYWVPFKDQQTATGEFVRDLPLAYLAEPEQVALEVARVVGPEVTR